VFHFKIISVNSIVLGDFNLCLRSLRGSSDRIYEFLCRLGYESLLDLNSSTTNCDTHIDWAMTNILDNRANARTFETIYSHHSGILVSVRSSEI